MFKIFSQIGRDAVILSIGTISTSALGFVLMPLYTRVFSTEEYGIIEMVNITAQMAGIMMALGMPSAFNCEFLQISDTEEQRKEIISISFLFICGRTRKGWFAIRRKTVSKKLRLKLKEIRAELRCRMHEPIPKQGAYLRSVVMGHALYFGVPINSPSISVFRKEACRAWLKILCRRSHKHRLTWDRMQRLIAKWIQPARICPPSFKAFWRYYLRQEPGALVAHAEICAGGAGKPPFLPRSIAPL